MACRNPSCLMINTRMIAALERCLVCHLQSYDSGFGQGSGRESHGEFSLCYTCSQKPGSLFRWILGFESVELVFVFFSLAAVKRFRRAQNAPVVALQRMKEDDGGNWFKGLTTEISAHTVSLLTPHTSDSPTTHTHTRPPTLSGMTLQPKILLFFLMQVTMPTLVIFCA